MSNEKVLLDGILEDALLEAEGNYTPDRFFELFSAEQVMKAFDASYPELEEGVVAGGNDGGIDTLYTLMDGILLDEDSLPPVGRKSPMLDLYVIQSKRSESFSEVAMDKLNTSLGVLLDLSKTPEELAVHYNEQVLTRIAIFRNALKSLAKRHPEVRVTVAYATTGDTTKIHPNVKHKASAVRATVETAVSGCTFSTAFLGARELLDLSRELPSYTLDLPFVETPIATASGYIVLASLVDYYNLITEHGVLRRYVFEANVRDYQGDNVEVNRDIEESLKNADVDFWWLNNGVTIITSRASITGKALNLDDVQIVNGLQTSMTIFNYLSGKEVTEADTSRNLLIRIVVTEDADTRDRIIKATNFQNPISPASLRATDRLQRDIEDYLKQYDWFYDRRKNYYKNLGKPRNRIVSIPNLAQAVISIVLQQPNYARARPSTLIKDDVEYDRIFSSGYELEVYHYCLDVLYAVNRHIREQMPLGYPEIERSMRFHVAMIATCMHLGLRAYHYDDVSALFGVEPTPDLLQSAFDFAWGHLKEFSESNDWSYDRILKSRDFTEYLLERL